MFISIRYLTIIVINKTFYLDLTYFKRHYSDRRYDKSIKIVCKDDIFLGICKYDKSTRIWI